MQTFSSQPKMLPYIFRSEMVQLIAHNPYPDRRLTQFTMIFSRLVVWAAGSCMCLLGLVSGQTQGRTKFLVWDYWVHCLHVRAGGRWEETTSRHAERNTECQDVAFRSPQGLMISCGFLYMLNAGPQRTNTRPCLKHSTTTSPHYSCMH